MTEAPQPPDAPAARDPTLSEIGDAIRASDLPRAISLAEAALDQGMEHPTLLSLRALGREQAGRLDDALADLKRARAMAPGRFDLANAMGLCLLHMERPEEAVVAFDETLKLNPDFAPAWMSRGLALEQTGDLMAARQSHEKAVSLKTDFAEPMSSLAAIAVRRRDLLGARRWAERALVIRPDMANALIALSAVDVAEGRPAEAERRMRSMLGRGESVGAFDMAHGWGVLGDALDALDRPAEAFAAWRECGRLTREMHRERFEGEGVQTLPRTLDWMSAWFRRTPDAVWAGPHRSGATTGEAVHVFLMGFPRSGTTLLEQILASHPSVVTLEERETLADSASAYLSDERGLTRLAAASVADLEPYRKAYWKRVRASGVDPTGKLFVDKMPLNTIKLPLIAKLFPQARILFAVRDPRDVVLSAFRHRFRMNASMYELLSPESAAALYDAVMGLGMLYSEKLKLRARRHRYEDLVRDFDGEVKAVFAFLGLPWRDEVRNFAERARAGLSATPSAAQVARGLYRGDGQWKRYAAELEPVIPVLQPWIERFGYAEDKA